MKLIVYTLLVLCLSCQLLDVVRASARYEKGLVMGYLLGNYNYFNGRLGNVPIPLLLAHVTR